LKSLKLIFMGTPSFALPSLEVLYNSEHKLAAVVTQPDKPVGRGKKVRRSPVKEWALKREVTVAQPENLRNENFFRWLREMAPDLIVTAAFGRILPVAILNLPPLGCINLHASYLPFYRGAAPIHRAVMEGATYSGVSIIELTSELDAGDIIMQEKEEILKEDTAGMLHDRLADKGASLLLQVVNSLAAGTAKPFPQDPQQATYAPLLSPGEERLDWQLSSIELYNRIRGLNPWPGAYTTLKDQRLKIWRAAPPEQTKAKDPGSTCGKPGEILDVGDSYISVACGSGKLDLLELQPAGKKRMDAGSFCCGYRIEPGLRFNEEQQS